MRAAPRWYVAVQRPIFRPTILPHDQPVGLIIMKKLPPHCCGAFYKNRRSI